jgi:hypothetical protein
MSFLDDSRRDSTGHPYQWIPTPSCVDGYAALEHGCAASSDSYTISRQTSLFSFHLTNNLTNHRETEVILLTSNLP